MPGIKRPRHALPTTDLSSRPAGLLRRAPLFWARLAPDPRTGWRASAASGGCLQCRLVL